MTPDINAVRTFLLDYQQRLCQALAQTENQQKFVFDAWERPQGGGGISAVLENGNVIEKGGVNFSEVYGGQLPASASSHRPNIAGASFRALGVSIVIHPNNPYVPTSHCNVRLFVAEKPDQESIWWFGGGFDLTPYYGFDEDCILWHQHAKKACDVLSESAYHEYKAWCDQYFYLKHREEPRGIGGIFFDDLSAPSFDDCFNFLQAVAESYLQAYVAIITKRQHHSFSAQEKAFQLYRRGRYVEFNLLYDRGTLFGLQSGGRTESILMSLPPRADWRYTWQPEKGSAEAQLTEYFLKPRDWLA